MKKHIWFCDQCKVQAIVEYSIIPIQWFELHDYRETLQFCSLICLMKWGTEEHQKKEEETKELADPPITSGCLLTWGQN